MARVSGARGTHESGGGQCRQVQSRKRQYSAATSSLRGLMVISNPARSASCRASSRSSHPALQSSFSGVLVLASRPGCHSAPTPPGGGSGRGRLCKRLASRDGRCRLVPTSPERSARRIHDRRMLLAAHGRRRDHLARALAEPVGPFGPPAALVLLGRVPPRVARVGLGLVVIAHGHLLAEGRRLDLEPRCHSRSILRLRRSSEAHVAKSTFGAKKALRISPVTATTSWLAVALASSWCRGGRERRAHPPRQRSSR
jgi:hypothetical protein